jgi:hypothetical protein
MENLLSTSDLPAILQQLTLAEVEQRLDDLDAERAALSLLRRSLAARDRAKRQQQRRKEVRDANC